MGMNIADLVTLSVPLAVPILCIHSTAHDDELESRAQSRSDVRAAIVVL